MEWKKVILGVFVLGSLLVVSERLALTESCSGKSLSGACGTRKSAAKSEAKAKMSAAEAAALGEARLAVLQAEAKEKHCSKSEECTKDKDNCAKMQASADCSGKEKACPYMSAEGAKEKGCCSEKVQGDVAEVKTEGSKVANVPAQE